MCTKVKTKRKKEMYKHIQKSTKVQEKLYKGYKSWHKCIKVCTQVHNLEKKFD